MPEKRRNVAILFFTMVVVMLGFGMVIPILPFYVESFGASGSTLGMLMATFSLMQFIFAPVWGNLSDRYGRKPILMIGVFGYTVAQLIFGLSTQLWMLFASRALAGILSSATLPTAMAYIGDSTSREERSGGMGLIGAAMGLGMVLGPGLAGWLASESLSAPFFLASGLSLCSLVLITLALPESLPSGSRRRKEMLGPRSQLSRMWRSLSGPVGFPLFLAFLFTFGLTNFEAIFGMYALERLGYGTQQVGTIMTVVGLASSIGQGLLTGPATGRWGEATVIKASLLGSSLGFAVMLMAGSFPTVLLTVGLFVFSNAMLTPSVSSLISKRSSGGQGEAMGLTNSFLSLGRVVGPTWAGFVFDLDSALPYLSGAVVMLIGFGASMLWLSPRQTEPLGAEV